MSETKTEETKKTKKAAKAHKYAVGTRLKPAGTVGTTVTVAEQIEGEDGPGYRVKVRHALFASEFDCEYQEAQLETIE